MKALKKLTGLKRVVALAAVLAMTGTGWAKKNGNGPGIPGDLNSTRDSVTLSVPVDAALTCDDTLISTQSYTVKAYIFQPSGRLLAIGIGTSDPFSCISGGTLPPMVDMTVDAFAGLTFKPGPATLLYQLILTDSTDPTMTTVGVLSENGSRVDLRP